MKVTSIAPAVAREKMKEGALLIDIRDPGEHAREHIAGALLCPLAEVEARDLGDGPLIFHCRSGNRTALQAERLGAKGSEVYVVEGGIDAWRKAGLPVVADKSQPIELMRQVQIAAGSLILLGMILAFALSSWFLIVPAFVGAGLAFAGLTGFCGMARLLMKAPWNRRAAA